MIKHQFPKLNIVAVRGDGYVYFDGTDGYLELDNIYANPASTSTDDMFRLCKEEIESVYPAEYPYTDQHVLHFEEIIKKYEIPEGTTHLDVSDVSYSTFMKYKGNGVYFYWNGYRTKSGEWVEPATANMFEVSDLYPLPSNYKRNHEN